MTGLERKILEFVNARVSACGGYPTTTEIEREIAHRDARHAVLSLAMGGLLDRHPVRKPYAPHRYVITDAGRDAIRANAVAHG